MTIIDDSHNHMCINCYHCLITREFLIHSLLGACKSEVFNINYFVRASVESCREHTFTPKLRYMNMAEKAVAST